MHCIGFVLSRLRCQARTRRSLQFLVVFKCAQDRDCTRKCTVLYSGFGCTAATVIICVRGTSSSSSVAYGVELILGQISELCTKSWSYWLMRCPKLVICSYVFVQYIELVLGQVWDVPFSAGVNDRAAAVSFETPGTIST